MQVRRKIKSLSEIFPVARRIARNVIFKRISNVDTILIGMPYQLK
jgi:hypothetical protein